MSQVKPPRLKLANRHYSQHKKAVLENAASVDAALRESEAFYRQMFERNAAVKLVIDPTTGRIIEANQAACNFYGYTLEQIKLLHITDITDLSETELHAGIQRTIKTKATTFQTRHRLSSGTFRDVEVFLGLLETNNEQYLYAIIQDITARIQAEKALRQSEKLLRLIIEHIPNTGVYMFDHDMRYTLAEAPYIKDLGPTFENLVGKTLQEVLPEDGINFLAPIYKRVLEGESLSYERVTEKYTYESYAAPVRDDKGQIIGGIILSHDITKRKQAEKALREREELHRLFIQHMPNTSIIMFDHERHFTLVEGDFLRRLGLISENMIGKLPHEVLSGETLDFMLPKYERVLQGEAFEYDRTTPTYAYKAYANPLKNAAGEIIGGMFLSHDITEAKHTEEALRISEARFHSLVDLAPVGIIQTDLQGKRVFCNSRWCEMTGITLEEALSDENYDTIYPDDLPIAAGAWEIMMETHLPFDNVIFRYQRPDKTTVWVSGNGRPLYDAQGEISGYIGSVTDITEHKLLEELLTASESRFRTLIDFAPVGIVETDAQGMVILGNERWSMLSGISQDRAFIDNGTETIHPNDVPTVQAMNQKMQEDMSPVDNLEYRFQHPDGKIVWVSASSRPIVNLEGDITGFIHTMTDITERKRAEDQFRALLESAPDAMVIVNQRGSIELVNSRTEMLFGYAREELIGKPVEILIPERFHSHHPAHREGYIADPHVRGMGVGLELYALRKDGNQFPVEISLSPIETETGTLIASAVRDVTERKRLEEALRQNEERLRNITDNLEDLVSQSDAEGNFVFVSRSYQTVLGYEPQSLIGKSAIDLIHPEDLPVLTQAMLKTIETGMQQVTFQSRLLHADGHYIHVESVGKLFVDSDNPTVFAGGVFISRDISERLRLQNLLLETEKLQTALDKELELNNLKTRMMNRIAHEFRTPLTVIQATTETLTYYLDRLNPDQRKAKEVSIKGQIQRLTNMLDEIGQVVKTDFTPERVHRTSTDLSALCRQVATQIEQEMNHPGQFVLELPERTEVSVDPQVLKKAFVQVMHNAARFSDPAMQVKVSLSRTENSITLRVRDTGIGIPPKEQPRIFEPFFRGSNIGESSGLGVGLTMTRAAVEAHGGTIAVDSVLGQGTTVTIWIPV